MTTTEPPKDMETKSTVGSGAAVPGTPGYQMAGQPAPEHGEGGLQAGYSNSEGMEGDDGASIFSESATKSPQPSGRRTSAKSSEK